MDSEIKKLRKLTQEMKKLGLLVYKTPEIELHLSPSAVFHEPEQKPAASEEPTDTEFTPEFVEEAAAHGMTPEDWRLIKWSQPGV